jgi:hypothetical protein
MTLWRIYSNDLPYGWREFGLDYVSRSDAIRVAEAWRKAWPRRKYVIRKFVFPNMLTTATISTLSPAKAHVPSRGF